MEQGYAKTKYVRIPPRKARLAANLIRGLSIDEAQTELEFCQMKAGHHLKKTLMSAVANAEMNHDARRDQLFVIEVRVDEGPYLKRAKSRSKGSRSPILKRMSHFTVVVGEESK